MLSSNEDRWKSCLPLMREVAGAKHRTEGEKAILSAPLKCSGTQPSPPVSFADSPLSRWGQGLHEQLHLSFDKLHQNYDLSQDLKISLLLNSSAPIVPFDENLFPSFLRYNALHRLIPLLILLLHNKNQQYNLLLLFAFENELYISAKNNTKAFAPTESYYFSTLWPIRYCFFDKVSLKSLCLNHVEILIEPLALPPCLPLMMGAQRKRCCLARSAGRRERKRSCPHRWNAVALSPLPQSASLTAPSADGAKGCTNSFIYHLTNSIKITIYLKI